MRIAAAAASAVEGDRAPEAIGRRHFKGCRASVARSATSLSRYTTPERAQKIAKAAVACSAATGLRSCLPKTSPAKTNRFFVHCPGRRETSRLSATDRWDRPAGTAVTVTSGEELRATAARG